MYDRKDLLNIRQSYQLVGDRGMSIPVIEEYLAKYAEQYHITVTWTEDMINNDEEGKETVQDCLVLYHPDHKDDYYNIVIDFEAPTKLAILSASIAGSSANNISRSGATALLQGGKMALANLEVANNETGDPQACAAEKEYYADLYNLINSLIGASQV